ncbi:MAG: glycosyltransferase family 9 protein [Planctomycetota bacterium]|jgi:lipopolysaccharide heptosyltransferase I
MPDSFKNILIIKPSSLGDIVLALPALTALRRSFPDAKISWLVRPVFAALLENHPHLDEIILFDRNLLGKAWFNPGAFCALVSLIRRLRNGRFDAVFDFQCLFRTASLAWLSGCRKRFGRAHAREFAHVFYTNKVPQDMHCAHLVDYYLKITRIAGAHSGSAEFVLPEVPDAAESIDQMLTNHGITGGNYAVLVPGSAHTDKCWPTERFAELADKISAKFGLSVIATGTEPEASVVERLKAKAGVSIVNLAGQTSLRELMALLKGAGLVVSNDTGPGHIAAASGVPLALIFGRSNPVRVAPYGRKHCVVAIDSDCRGLDINSADPRHDIKAITVDQVYQKVCEQLDSRADK